jgi:hypothetical protein
LKASTTAPFIKASKAFATNAVALGWWPFRVCECQLNGRDILKERCML